VLATAAYAEQEGTDLGVDVLGGGTVAFLQMLRERCACREPCHLTRVGAENPVTSRDLHILVNETAEPFASQRPDDRFRGWRGTVRRRVLIQRSVRTVGVVMPDVLA
jgi:hypothetical protein